MYLLNIIQITIFFFHSSVPSISKYVCIYVCLFVRASLRFYVLLLLFVYNIQHFMYIKKGNWNRKKRIRKVYYICIQWLIVCRICSIEIMIHVSNKILSVFFFFFAFSKPSSFLHLNGFIFYFMILYFVVCCMLRITMVLLKFPFFSLKYRHIFRQTISLPSLTSIQNTEVTQNVQ